MRRIAAVLAVLTCAVALLAGCGDDEPSDSSDGKSDQTINITITGDSVDPNGERVPVKAGEPITLIIKADEKGELHVHSSPEQEIPYGAGTTQKTLTIDQPGVVEVESHALEKVIVQLEVS